jgi:transposase-like protein
MALKRQYSDEDKARALLALEANGGNVSRTSREQKIPASTIAEWRDGRTAPSVTDIRDEKRAPLVERLTAELNEILNLMPEKRAEASYGDLMRGAGILTDKIQLLSGKDTERSTIRVVYDDVPLPDGA